MNEQGRKGMPGRIRVGVTIISSFCFLFVFWFLLGNVSTLLVLFCSEIFPQLVLFTQTSLLLLFWRVAVS